MLIVGNDHLATGADIWLTNTGCFDYTVWIWKQEGTNQWMVIDDIVGPIAGELFMFARQWEHANPSEDVLYDEKWGKGNFTNQNYTHNTGIYKYKFTDWDAIACGAGPTESKSAGLIVESNIYDNKCTTTNPNMLVLPSMSSSRTLDSFVMSCQSNTLWGSMHSASNFAGTIYKGDPAPTSTVTLGVADHDIYATFSWTDVLASDFNPAAPTPVAVVTAPLTRPIHTVPGTTVASGESSHYQGALPALMFNLTYEYTVGSTIETEDMPNWADWDDNL